MRAALSPATRSLCARPGVAVAVALSALNPPVRARARARAWPPSGRRSRSGVAGGRQRGPDAPPGERSRGSVVASARGEPGESSAPSMGGPGSPGALPPGDAALVQLYAAGCALQWPALVPLARAYAALPGASETALRATTRHLITFAGYAPCLKATLTLHKAGAYQFGGRGERRAAGEEGVDAAPSAADARGPSSHLAATPSVPPGKTRGRPGDAFEAVYGPTTDRVRASMHAADPVVGEWMRVDLYGDVYSSPGISMRLKEIVACAFLAAADMPDQLLGHAVAALRFGATGDELREAAGVGCAWIGPWRTADAAPRDGSARAEDPSPFRRPALVPNEALRVLALAEEKVKRGVAKGSMVVAEPVVSFPDGEAYSVVVPPLPALFNVPGGRPAGESDPTVAKGAEHGAGRGGCGAFAWEALRGAKGAER